MLFGAKGGSEALLEAQDDAIAEIAQLRFGESLIDRLKADTDEK